MITPILERPGLGLVGVADQVVRAARLAGHGIPLAPGREGGAAAAHELGVEHLADDGLGADLERAAQRLVAAVRAVVLEGVRIDHADPPQEAKPGLPGLGRRGRARGRRGRAVQDLNECAAVDVRELPLGRAFTGLHQEGSGRSVALAKARAACQVAPSSSVPGGPIFSVSAAISLSEPAQRQARSLHTCRTRGGRGSTREQGVERGHAEDVRRRDRQPLRYVVERAGADPAGPRVEGVQRGEQLVALGAGGMTAVSGVAVLDPVRPGPRGHRRAEERVDRRALVGGRFGVEETEIHAG